MPLPPIVSEFIVKLRNAYVQQEPTAKRLSLASYDIDLSPAYLKGALAMSPKPLRELLLNMFDYELEEPEEGEEPEPDYRVEAAQLFLYGIEAGNWTATAREIEQARAHVIARYGKEAFDMLASEKTKDDLAREAGVPNKSFTYKPTNLLRNVPILKDEDRRHYETVLRVYGEWSAAHNSDVSYRDKLRAIQRLLASVELVRPDLQAMWPVEFIQLLGLLREVARRYWQLITRAESK